MGVKTDSVSYLLLHCILLLHATHGKQASRGFFATKPWAFMQDLMTVLSMYLSDAWCTNFYNALVVQSGSAKDLINANKRFATQPPLSPECGLFLGSGFLSKLQAMQALRTVCTMVIEWYAVAQKKE